MILYFAVLHEMIVGKLMKGGFITVSCVQPCPACTGLGDTRHSLKKPDLEGCTDINLENNSSKINKNLNISLSLQLTSLTTICQLPQVALAFFDQFFPPSTLLVLLKLAMKLNRLVQNHYWDHRETQLHSFSLGLPHFRVLTEPYHSALTPCCIISL